MFTLFITFFQIGLFTIGGGYAMIPLISQYTTEYGWLALEELTDFIGISESTPGPFAVNIATFIGMQEEGILGAFFATLGVVLPSFIIILFIAKYFQNVRNNFFVNAAFEGLRPATLGLIISSVWMIAANTFLQTGISGIEALKWKSFVIFGILLLTKILYKKIHPIALIGLSAALGIVFYGLIP